MTERQEKFLEKLKKTDPASYPAWKEYFDMGGAPTDPPAHPTKPAVKTYTQAEVDAMKKSYEDKLAAASTAQPKA